MHNNDNDADPRSGAKFTVAIVVIVGALLSIGSLKFGSSSDDASRRGTDETHNSRSAGAGCLATSKFPLFYRWARAE
jgi:hypothetical protein